VEILLSPSEYHRVADVCSESKQASQEGTIKHFVRHKKLSNRIPQHIKVTQYKVQVTDSSSLQYSQEPAAPIIHML